MYSNKTEAESTQQVSSPLTCELVPEVHGGVTADHLLERLQMANTEQRLLMIRVGQPWLHLQRPVAVVIEGPQLHCFVRATRQEVFLPSKWSQSHAQMVQEALQADLVEVKVGILLVETDLILPAGQPVALQGEATARELLFQSAVLWGRIHHPGGGGGGA